MKLSHAREGVRATLEPCDRGVGFIDNALKMEVYLRVCSVVLR